MRRLLLLALLVLPAAAYAQRARPFAEKGDLALVVGVSPGSFPDITSAFDGIGLRYRATDRSVIGASVGFDVATSDGSGDTEGTQNTGGVRVALWNENHVGRGRGPVSPFVGGGIIAGYRRSTYTRDVFPCDPAGCPGPPCDPAACPGVPEGVPGGDSPQASQRVTGYSVGVGAILGAEVRLARGVTLGAAYTLGVAVERFSATNGGPVGPFGGGTFNGGTTLVAGGTGLTDLHLSVYF